VFCSIKTGQMGAQKRTACRFCLTGINRLERGILQVPLVPKLIWSTEIGKGAM